MKEKIFKKGIVRRLLSLVLALAMVISLTLANSLTVFAENNEALLVTITVDYDDRTINYSAPNIATIEESGTVFHTSVGGGVAGFRIGSANNQTGSITVKPQPGCTITKVEFVVDQNITTAIDTAAPFTIYGSGWGGSSDEAKSSLNEDYSNPVATTIKALNITEIRVYGHNSSNTPPTPLTFTAQDDSVTISLKYLPKNAAYQYSVDDGASWAAFTSAVPVNDGESIQICMNPSVKDADVTYGKSVGNFLQFKTEGEGTLTASGDVMSLLAADTENLPNYVFYKLFSGVANLTDASELKLPATTLAEACYSYMFSGCKGLTEAPKLPATTLAKSCYGYMFQGCTALTAAPELPATTLAEACYANMFYNCAGLTEAPELPATTMVDCCYQKMFYGCTALTAAPELPATTLANNCYQSMFSGCKALTKAPELPATTLEYECYRNMFQDCDKLTVVPELPATTLADYCYACMFMNCTALKTAFATLPATELTSNCYNGMFAGCTALTTAPALPAINLAKNCYYQMFKKCEKLTATPELKATTMAESCYDGMFMGCKSLTKTTKLPATNLAKSCYNAMFADCIGLTTAPELPASNLIDYCYSSMFNGCTNLTSAPELKATTLAEGCYQNMFKGCTALQAAPELPAKQMKKDCYNNMFRGCTSLTELPELPATELAESCYLSMFYGCTGIKLGTTETEDAWKIPVAKTDASDWNKYMFNDCTGVDLGDGSKVPELNTTYYQILPINGWKEIQKVSKATSGTNVTIKDDDENELFTYSVDGESISITLKADLKAKKGCAAIAIPTGKNVTIDLNGHAIDANGICGIFSVAKDATLTLNDSSNAKSGKLTGGVAPKGGAVENLGTFTMNAGTIESCEAIHKDGELADGNGGGVYNAGTFNMNGGTIDGCTAYCGGAGVFNEYVESVFNFNGGTIKNCTAANETMQDSCGGGIYNNIGKVVMDGGIIDGCSAQKNGGGVYNTGVFELKSGEIKNCSTEENCGAGGGVYNAMNTVMNFYRTTFNMFGGKITGCSAQFGGAIANEGNAEASCYVSIKGASQLTGNEANDGGGAIYNLGEMKLNDTASITGNKAGGLGGGVYSDGKVTLCKSVKITDNKQGETKASNLYLDTNATLTLSGLTTGAEIGIGVKAADGIFVSSGATLELVGFFKADGDKFVLLSGDQLLLSDVNITGSDDKLVGDLDAVNAALGKISEIETAIDTLAGNFNGNGEGAAASESIFNVLGSYGYVYVDLTGIKFEEKAENAVATTEITTFTFDVTPYTVIGETASEQHTLVSEVTFRLPLLATDYKYANIYHNGSFLKQVELSGTDEYIELSAKNFSEYSYMLTNTKYTVPTGGGSSAPTITVPVTGDENTVKVQASVSGSTATVKDITEADLKKVSGGGNIEIDLSGLNKNIDSAKIPAATVEKIAEQSGMTVKLSTATVTFDSKATETISEQAKGNTIELVVDDIKTVSLNAIQKEAVQKLDTALIIDAYLVSDGTRLCSEDKGGFGGGKATVALPFEIKGSRTAANYSVYYVDDAGKLEKLNASYDAAKKAFVFDIEHFSNYVVAYDENAMLFVDVAESSFYYDAVLWAAKNGITTGTDATHFSPEMGTTRAQVVTFLWRAAGCPEPKSMNSFADVVSGSYYEKAVAWAIEQGITKGTSETTFSPDVVCTRAHIVTFLARFAGVKDEDTGYTHGFNDVKATDYFNNAVAWAATNKVTEGTSAATFSPHVDCTRAQVVTFLYRWMVK